MVAFSQLCQESGPSQDSQPLQPCYDNQRWQQIAISRGLPVRLSPRPPITTSRAPATRCRLPVLGPRRGRRVETNHQLWAEPGYGNAGTPCGSPSGAPITNYCSYAPHNNHRGWHQLLIMTREPGKRRPQCLIAFDDRKLCVYDTPRDTVVFVFGD